MSKKMRFLSFFLALAMVISSAPIVPVYAQEDSLATGMTNPFDKNISFSLNGQLVKSDSYRIPSIVTLADGTVVAAADIRWNTTYDGGGLDTLVARSTDGGKTWSYNVANYLGDNGNQYNPQSTTFIDPNLLVAADGQTVYMLVDLYAYGVALNGNGSHIQPVADTGFDSNGNLKLSNDNHYSYNYYLKNSKIYDSSNNVVTGYEVDAYFNITYTQNGEIKQSNLFFADSPFKVARTQYLYLTKSTDGGATWSEPNLLDVRAKAKVAATENALLVSPGNSITTSGGIMVYPVYSYKTDGTQHVALIYSTDGVNWERSTDYTALNWSSEGAIVELENGNIRVFVRNKTKHLCYVDFDVRTMTWIGHTDTGVPTNSNTQLSAITYSKTSNGDQVVLVSCPTGPNGAGSDNNDGSMRTNGKIHVFTVNAAGDMTLKNTINVFDKMATSQLSGSNYTEEKGFFAYSALTELSDGSIALLYENNQFSWGAGKGKYFTITNKGFASSSLGIKLDKPVAVVVDKNGNAVNSLQLGLSDKVELQTNTFYFESADVHYQWQIEAESGKWIDIRSENNKTITITLAKVATILLEEGAANIRCKTYTATQTAYSGVIPVTIAMYQPPEEEEVVISNSFVSSTGEPVTVTVAGYLPENTAVALKETDSSGVDVAYGETVVTSLDISILNKDGTEWQPASGEYVRVSLDASELGLSDGDEVAIYHLHNTEVDILGKYVIADGKLEFLVDSFSKFVVALVEEEYDFDYCKELYAVLNAYNQWIGEGSFDYFWLKSNAQDSQEKIYEWSIYDEGFEIDLVVSIDDYYVDKDGGLWFHIKPVNGLELPAALQERSWIFMNNVDQYDGEYDTLYLFEPEDLSKEDIVVLDKYGLSAWDLYLYSNETKEVTVQTKLTGEVQYRWEVCYDTTEYLWVAIEGETSPTLTLTYAKLSGVLQDGEWAALRCVAYNASESVTSNVIIASVLSTEYQTFADQPQEPVIVVTSSPEVALLFEQGTVASLAYTGAEPLAYNTSAKAYSVAPLAEDDTPTSVLVTVQFVMGNNSAPIENGLFTYYVPYNGSVSSNIIIPTVQGYAAYLEDDRTTPVTGTYALNKTGVTDETTITFRFWPAEVSYKVLYMQQNVSDDGYTVVRTDNLVGLTGSDPVVEDVDYEGFVQVWCDTDVIASDGSTVIEVKYDRLYYKMLFDLDGGYGVQPVYARYGTPISVINPSKAGYIFLGWNALNGPYSDGDDSTVDISEFTDIVIPAIHTNYKALWEAADTAKVTVIIWGQNADDDGYSYLAEASKDLSFQANPGTSVTYNPNGGYVCGLEAHTHGAGCSTNCGKEAHSHSINDCYEQTCTKAEHTVHTESCYNCGGLDNHTIACYTSSSGTLSQNRETNTTRLAQLSGMSGPSTNGGLYRIGYYSNYRYYFKFGDNFYQVTGNVNNYTSVSKNCECDHIEHTDSCTMICTVHEHTVEDCYKLACTKPIHTHTASCYSCGKVAHTHGAGCTLTINNMSSNLWTFSHADTVTVAADGSTTLNVYYDRTTFTLTFKSGNSTVATISEKWGASISEKFSEAPFNTTYNGRAWKCTETSKYSYALQTLDVMPQFNATFNLYNQSSQTLKTIYYYVEKVGANVSENTWPGTNNTPDTNNFVLLKEVDTYFNFATYEEEYHEMVGFTRYSTSVSGFGSDKEKDFSNNKLYLYYLRDEYNLVFNNYGTNERTESVLYEAPLSTYSSFSLDPSKAPDVYQPGSVEFKGWYLAPQTPNDFNFDNAKPFDFANSKMPAGDMILYAWWAPVEHTVTFYYDYAALEAGTVYTEDGEKKQFGVPHGSKIQYPYTPPKDPTSSYYSFVGWAYKDATGTEYLWEFDYSTVTEDVNLYGKWNSTTPANYEVRFVTVKDGVEIEIADPIIGAALGGTAKTFNAKVNTDLYEGYQDRYYPQVMSHTITINLEDTTKNTFTFYYDYVEYTSYNVKYLDKDTGKELATEKIVSQNTHAMIVETFVPIAGYLPDAYYKVCYIDPDGTNEIIFYYTKDNENGLWTVHFWLENQDGSYTEAADLLFTGTAAKGATVTAPTDTVIENYYYYAEHSSNVSTGTVSIEEVTHLHMYYKRTVHDYTVQYLEAGTNKVLAPNKVVEDLKWGTLVTENAIDIPNYQTYGDTTQSLEVSVDEATNVITFYYVEKYVNINYVAVGPEGAVDFGTVTPSAESLAVITGVASGSVAAPSSSVYKFVGWYSNVECTNKIGDEATYVPTKEADKLWVDGTTYYAKFEYNLTSLTIKKDGVAGYANIDPNQTFIFNIRGNGIDLDVTVHGSDWDVVVDGLTVGATYTITEKTDWSWRYNCTGWYHDNGGNGTGNIAQITIGLNSTITFTNTRGNEQWLDGDSWCNNIFK